MRAELAGVDHAGECLQPLPASLGGERFARDPPLELERTERRDHRDRPAAVAHGTHCLFHRRTTDAIEEQVDAAGDNGQDLFDPVDGVVVDHFAGAQAPHVRMVGRAGHA